MNKEADLLDSVYKKLNNQQLISQLEEDYVGFSKSPKGKLIYRLYSMIPSTYAVDSYKIYKSQQPIKIIFTGVGDSDLSKISKNQFNKRYPDKKLYFFGWPQYRQAMIFASGLDPEQPVQVYGHSWGSNAARKFIQNYQGNIIEGHFFDPMRRDVQGDETLQITRDVPITYTPIIEQPRNIKTALHNALRLQPSQRMLVTQAASKHDSVAQWLNILDKPEEVKKVANFLFKYGSYSQCLYKKAQQRQRKVKWTAPSFDQVMLRVMFNQSSGDFNYFRKGRSKIAGQHDFGPLQLGRMLQYKPDFDSLGLDPRQLADAKRAYQVLLYQAQHLKKAKANDPVFGAGGYGFKDIWADPRAKLAYFNVARAYMRPIYNNAAKNARNQEQFYNIIAGRWRGSKNKHIINAYARNMINADVSKIQAPFTDWRSAANYNIDIYKGIPKIAYKNYVIKSGDSFGRLQARSGNYIPLHLYVSANAKYDPKRLQPGMTVMLPYWR